MTAITDKLVALSGHFPPFLGQCSALWVFKAEVTRIIRKSKWTSESPRIELGTLIELPMLPYKVTLYFACFVTNPEMVHLA